MTTGIVTRSQYTVNPPEQVSVDSVLEVRGWYSRNFIAGDGVTPVFGSPTAGQEGPYYSISVSLNGSGDLVVAAQDIQATTLSDPTGNYFEQLYVDGAPSIILMPNTQGATGWQIPTTYGTTIAFDEIATYNRARRLVYAPDTYFTADEVIAEIRRLAGDFMYAAVGVNGITSMDVAPTLASLPIAVGANSYASPSHLGISKLSYASATPTAPVAVETLDPRMGSWINVLTYGAVGDNSTNNTTAFTNAQTAAAVTGAGLYIPVGTFRLTGGFAFTSPVMFAPGASVVKHVGGAISFAAPVTADYSAHFASTSTIVVTFGMQANTVAIPQWWAGCMADGVTDCGPGLQGAINSGVGKIFVPKGQYGIGTPITITVSDFVLEGESRVLTDIFPLVADIHVGSGPNALIVNSSPTLNAMILRLRFTSQVAFSGWAIWAEDGVQGGEALFSTIIADCFVSMGTASLGFLHGGMSDCLVFDCDIENTGPVFDLVGASSVSSSTFLANRMTACVGSFISCMTNASSLMMVIALEASNQLQGTLLDIKYGENWQSTAISLEYGTTGGTGTAEGGLARFDTCTQSTLTNFRASRVSDRMGGVTVNNSQVKISDGYIYDPFGSTATPYGLAFVGYQDTDIENVTIERGLEGGSTPQQVFILANTSGNIRFADCNFTKGPSRIFDCGASVTANISIRDSDLTNGQFSGRPITSISNANPCVLFVRAHGFTTGQTKTISGVTGTLGTAINGARVVTVLTANTFSIPVNTTASSVYCGSGGSIGAGTGTGSIRLFTLATSGRLVITGNTIGVDDGLATPLADFAFNGSGDTWIDGNTFIGTGSPYSVPVFSGGSAQVVRMGLNPGYAMVVYAAAMPTTLSWTQGTIAWNLAAAAGQPIGWMRLTTGSGNVLNTDWKAMANL